MGGPNKLLAQISGKPLVRIAAEQALASRAKPVVVVTGHQRAQVEAAAAQGKHVFCEKPFALTLADAQAALAACRRAKVALGDGPERHVEQGDQERAVLGLECGERGGHRARWLSDLRVYGFDDLVVGAPDANLHLPGGGGVAVLYGKAQGVRVTLTDLWEKSYPYFFHADFPDTDNPASGHVAVLGHDMARDAPRRIPRSATCPSGSVSTRTSASPRTSTCSPISTP